MRGDFRDLALEMEKRDHADASRRVQLAAEAEARRLREEADWDAAEERVVRISPFAPSPNHFYAD